LTEKYNNLTINVYKIINHFFGESITVSGLLTGQDMLRQLRGKPLGEELLVPANALRAEDGDFLCGMQLAELSSGVGTPVRAVASDGFELVCALLGEEYAQREGI
jgi:NifB/MoaA-like Fe-S oxidoreductase